MPDWLELFLIAIIAVTVMLGLVAGAAAVIAVLYTFAGLLLAIPAAIVMIAAFLTACAFFLAGSL